MHGACDGSAPLPGLPVLSPLWPSRLACTSPRPLRPLLRMRACFLRDAHLPPPHQPLHIQRGYFASSGDVVEAMRRVHGFHYDTSRGLSQEQRTKALASKNPIVSGAVHTMPSALISFISSISDWSSLLAWAGAIVLFVIFGAGDIELHEGSGPSDDPDKRSDYWTITSKFGFLGGITMMSLVFVCSLTKFLSDRLAREQLPPLQPLLRARASVRVDGRMQELTAPQLVRGDVVRLEAGQVVPADCVVIALDDDVESLTVRGDLAMMSKHRDVDESIHVAFAGSRVRVGQGWAVVLRPLASCVAMNAYLAAALSRGPPYFQETAGEAAIARQGSSGLRRLDRGGHSRSRRVSSLSSHPVLQRLFACRNGAALRHMIRIFIIAGYAVGMGVVAFESTGLSHLIYATFGAAALATLGVIWGAASVLRGNALFQAALLTLRNDSEMATRMITARAGFTPVGASIGRAG